MSQWKHDPFFQYPLSSVPTSAGEVALPIMYFDSSHLMALFRVDYEKARAIVADPALEPLRFAHNTALVGVAFYDYRETAIADYREVGTAIAVVPRDVPMPSFPLLSLFAPLDKNKVGFHIVDLPVTTPAACAAGKDIWGYPKFVTQIDFELSGRKFAGAVTDPQSGGDILQLSGTVGAGMPGPLLDLILYSRHQEKSLRTLVNTRGGCRVCLPGSLRLTVGCQLHPMAKNLIALGLAHAKPWMVLRTHSLQLRLNQGAALPN